MNVNTHNSGIKILKHICTLISFKYCSCMNPSTTTPCTCSPVKHKSSRKVVSTNVLKNGFQNLNFEAHKSMHINSEVKKLQKPRSCKNHRNQTKQPRRAKKPKAATATKATKAETPRKPQKQLQHTAKKQPRSQKKQTPKKNKKQLRRRENKKSQKPKKTKTKNPDWKTLTKQNRPLLKKPVHFYWFPPAGLAPAPPARA